MNPKLIIFTILGVAAMLCFTVIVCVYLAVQSNERAQQHFLVNVPNKSSGF
jgi:hypothetical protein